MSPLLEIRDLHMKFSLFEGLSHVLNGVNLSVEMGERVAIVGESGCGKSVTVRAILGLLRQKYVSIEGSIRFHDSELLALRERALARDTRAPHLDDLSRPDGGPEPGVHPSAISS